jgi:ER-bound oxygenase mpaB/B'/Rubber oxygenase, catalytic domain
MSHHPRSERAIKSIARMNYIHGRYREIGKISQDNLLYTLSLFITEPIAWIHRCEWRDLTQMEICALATFWKSMGDAMDIKYTSLKRHNTGWKDGIEFYEDIKEWAKNYEKNCMIPARSNKQTAENTLRILLFTVPERFKWIGRNMIISLLDDRLRAAMMYVRFR